MRHTYTRISRRYGDSGRLQRLAWKPEKRDGGCRDDWAAKFAMCKGRDYFKRGGGNSRKLVPVHVAELLFSLVELE